MEEEPKFDTFCCNPDCINSQQAFFKYSPDNEHQAQNHTIRILHPVFFNRFCSGDKTNPEQIVARKEAFKAQIEEIVTEECSKMTTFLRQKYMQPFAEELNKKLTSENSLDATTICNRLKQGDCDLLKSIMEYEQTSKNDQEQQKMPFIDYYQYRETNLKEIKTDVSSLGDKIKDIIEIAFDNYKQIVEMESMVQQEISQKKAAALIKPVSNPSPVSTAKASSQKSRNVPVVDKRQKKIEDYQHHHNDDSFVIEKNKKIKKKKTQVKKEHNDARRIEQEWVSEEEDEKETVDCSKEITVLNDTEIRIDHCVRPKDTYHYITRTFKSLTSLHVFHHKFATDKIIRHLLRNFPYLKTLTFNCNHRFHWDMLDDLSTFQLSNFNKLELKWALDLFFQQYHLTNQFPTKSWDNRERNSKSNMPLQKFIQLPNNDTLWVESDEHAHQLNSTRRSMAAVSVLHFNPAAFQKLGHLRELGKFEQLQNLTTLILKGVNLSCEEDFNRVVLKNPKLTTVMISQCTNLKKQTDSVFESLARLQHLQSFSLTPRNQTLLVKPESLLKLTKLRNLYLSKVNFEDENARYKDSSNLRNICHMRNLKHLSLYACNPVFSDMFTYLNPECFQKLEFLSIGYTEVDNTGLEEIRKMPNLKHLNIDGVNISGRAFVDICKSYPDRYGKFWPLQTLSIEQMSPSDKESLGKVPSQRFTLENFEEMAQFLPELSYIGIRNCQNLRTFDFGKMPSLRTVALNKELKGMMAYLPATIEIYEDSDDS